MSALEQFAADLARAAAPRPTLRFPDRKIIAIPHDPIAHATGAIKSAADDFMFAIAEAFNCGDVDGLKDLREHIAHCTEAMRVVEMMAADFTTRIIKE